MPVLLGHASSDQPVSSRMVRLSDMMQTLDEVSSR
jgi:hypothetical protein